MVANELKLELSKASLVRQMFEKGLEMKSKLGEDAVYDFSLGNPIFEPPAEFYQGLKSIISDGRPGKHRYMTNAGLQETRELVAKSLSKEHGIEFKAKHIVMTVGAGGGLNVVFKAILNLTEVVYCFAPYFMEYANYVKNHGGRLETLESDDKFQPIISNLSDNLKFKVKALLLNSPNNPTGMVYSQECYDSIAKVLTETEKKFDHPVYIVSDEPYNKILYDDIKNPSIFKSYKNSILVTSHSKDFSLAGERIGYIAVHPEIDNCDLLIEALAYCNRILGFVNAPALMQRILQYLYEKKIDNNPYFELREAACKMLDEVNISYIKPNGAFYIFPKSPIADDIKFANLAAENGVLVVPGSGFGRKGYFRMSYSVPKEKIIASTAKFKQTIDQLKLK